MDRLVLFSIVVPCYNHSRYLNDFLDSVIDQDYPNIELIICDDCSTDNSLEVIKERELELKEKLTRFVLLVNEKNQGTCKTINRAIAEASGTYIKPMASDDMLLPGYITSVVDVFEQNCNVDVVVTNGIRVSEETRYNARIKGATVYQEEPNFGAEGFFERLYQGNYIFSPGMTIRYEALKKNGAYNDLGMVDDWELALRYVLGGCIYKYLDKELICYRISPLSMSSTAKAKGAEDRRLILFNMEYKIIEHYAQYVPKKVYLERKYNYLYDTKIYADEYGFLKLKKEVQRNFHFTCEELLIIGLTKVISRHLLYYYFKYKHKILGGNNG